EKQVGVIAGPKGDMRAYYSRNGTQILTVSSQDAARLWSSDNQQEIFNLGDATATVADFSPDGERIVTLSRDKAIIWSAQTGKRISEIVYFHGVPSMKSFSPDGQKIVGGSINNEARIWSTESGQVLLRLQGQHRGAV